MWPLGIRSGVPTTSNIRGRVFLDSDVRVCDCIVLCMHMKLQKLKITWFYWYAMQHKVGCCILGFCSWKLIYGGILLKAIIDISEQQRQYSELLVMMANLFFQFNTSIFQVKWALNLEDATKEPQVWTTPKRCLWFIIFNVTVYNYLHTKRHQLFCI